VSALVSPLQSGGFLPADRRGASPVIAVILMIAVVLVLASLASGLVFTFAQSTQEPPPTGSFEFSQSANDPGGFWDGEGADSNLTIRYRGGEAFDPGNVELAFGTEPEDQRDGFRVVESDAPSSGDTLADIGGVDDDLTGTVRAGDSVTIPFEGDNAMSLVYRGDDGDSAARIATYRGTGVTGPQVSLQADDSAPGAKTTHTVEITAADYGEVGVDGADGDELDTITVSYPVTGRFLDLDQNDITVTMKRLLSGGLDRSEITVNSDDYSGFQATFDLSGFATTDLAGPIRIEIAGIRNPLQGGDVEITLDGDAGAKTVTGAIPVDDGPVPVDVISPDTLTAGPDTIGAPSTHSWSFSDVDFTGEVDEIYLGYSRADASFDGLDESDVTVEITRSGESKPTEIRVNEGAYTGERARLDLDGTFSTDIDGLTRVTIDGIRNPDVSGEYSPKLVFEGKDDFVVAEGELDIAD
jgi:flagellin-like protein